MVSHRRWTPECSAVVGGAETVAHLLDADLIDELRFTLHPLVAGKGLALFDKVERRHLFRTIMHTFAFCRSASAKPASSAEAAAPLLMVTI